MPDAELDVLLEPANDLEDEIDSPEVEADVDGGGRFGGGRGSTAGAAGGLAILGKLLSPLTVIVGLLTAILSQTRSVQQFTGGLFRTFERQIAPLLTGLIQGIRPGIEKVAQSLADLDLRNALTSISDNIVRGIQRLSEDILGAVGIEADLTPDGPGGVPQGNLTGLGFPQPQFQDTETTAAERPQGLAPFAAEALDSINPKTADRQDEDKKEIIAGSFSQQSNEKAGGGGLG